MNLKDFLTNRDNPPELYWSIVAEDGWVQAGIWYIGETAAEVVSISPGAAWSSDDEFTGAVDAALSSAIQKLPENYKEPNKTVFAVSSSWVKDGEISEEYLEKIKKLCADLSLAPVGFVVLPEAIAHLYKSEEGAPLNSVILGLGAGSLEISVFKLGNLVGTTQVSRSVSLIEDVIEGLSRFEGASPLPSRFIVYDGKEGELEEAKEALMGNSWDGVEKIKFLHTPKAEILDTDRKVLATCLAGANEIGNVTKVDSKEISDDGGEETPVEEEKPNVAPAEPGWEATTAENLGFAIGTDISASAKSAPVPPQRQVPPQVPVVQKPKFDAGKIIFHAFSKLPKVSSPKFGGKGIYALVAAVILLIAGVLFWWFVPKAKITVYVTPKRFEQKSQIAFSTSGTSDPVNGIIPADLISVSASGDKTKSTTGVKLIGDKAKGSVKILNFTQSIITLAHGTQIISGGNLHFTTINEASISGVVANGSENVPGQTPVDVIATDIGSQYNLPKDEVFIVGNYSKINVRSQSTADFTGGSSQEVSAVSKDDLTNLETGLKDELKQRALNDAMSKVTSTEIFVNDWAGVDTVSESFDHKLNEQADSIKLSMAINAKGIAPDKAKLLEYAKSALKDKIPSGYSLGDNEVDFKFTFSKADGDKYTFDATIGANFLPKIDSQKIISKMTGKTQSVVENYLNSIPGFSRAAIALKPRLPGPLGTLPQIEKNITLQITPEQ